MTTLVIHHPEDNIDMDHRKSFSYCFKKGVGKEFAIPSKYIPELKQGIKVVVLCNTKGHERRAEGTLSALVHSGYIGDGKGMKRYDVTINNIKTVGYHRDDFERLLHTGVAVF